MNKNIISSRSPTLKYSPHAFPEAQHQIQSCSDDFEGVTVQPMAIACYKDLKALFPPKESFSYRPIIVWAMNDRLDQQELNRQLASFKTVGYGGIMVMPWGGLPYSFMDDEWLDIVRHILEEAMSLGLDVWLWDDWLFGSGPAGGGLTRNPAYRAKTLKVLIDIIVEPGESLHVSIPPRAIAGSFISVNKFGNPVDNTFESIPVSPGQSVSLRAMTRKRIIIVGWEYTSGMQHTTKSHAKFLNPDLNERERDIYVSDDANVWSVDMLNSQAIGDYLKLIHERYWEAMPEFFGKTLKGFFYDEPKSATRTPWTQTFAEEFRVRKGYDLLPYLPSMLVVYLQDGGNFTDKFRPEQIKQAEADYRDVWTSLMAETFYGTVQRWCRQHQVIATGHPIGDNSLDEVLSNGGCYFKNMAFSDMPGVDTVGGFNNVTSEKFFDFPRLPGSQATVSGKPRAMSESFAVYGHGLHLDQMRFVCAHQIVRNVNTFFCKLTNYNRQKSFYFHPPELSDYNPLIKHFGPVFCEWIENVSGLMTTGEMIRPRIALYVGIWNYFRGDTDIAQRTTQIAEWLTYHQIEFDYVWDQDILNMQGSGREIRNQSGQSYRYIVIPRQALAPSAIQDKFNRWEKDNLILNEREMDLDDLTNICRKERQGLLKLLSSYVKISMRSRMLDEAMQCSLLLNESETIQQLTLETAMDANVFEVNLNTWQVSLLTKSGPNLPFEVTLCPSESRLYLFDAAGRISAAPMPNNSSTKEIPLQDWVVITPDQKTIALPSLLPNWSELGYSGYTGFMRYRCRFYWDGPASQARLSLGELRYAATVLLDGFKVGNCVFSPFELTMDNLSPGEHVLEIDVLNTQANTVFGNPARLKSLHETRRLDGTYAPLYEKFDIAKLRSGLLGPVTLHQLSSH
jgi:hypothetical protein